MSSPAPADLTEQERSRVQRRTLRVVVASQVLGGAGLAAGATVGALLAEEVLGSANLAGVPTALFTLGSASAALLIGRITQHLGRRLGLAAGFAAGGLGSLGVVVSAASDNVVLLLVSLLVYGSGTATNLQARYAGTDLALPTQRGTAVSLALVSTTVGAVAGPNLVEPLGGLALALGLPVLAGPFLLAGLTYLAAAAFVFVMLRPDPYLLARHQGSRANAVVRAAAAAPASGVHVGAAIMVLTQIAMVAIMTMTPVHMRAHHHDLGEIGLVISLHIAAMFLPSPLTGLLVDRLGRTVMAVAAAVTLLLAGVTAMLAPGDSLTLLVVALALLGLGWNFGLISGTALVVDATLPADRPKVQGTIDVLIALAGAGGGVTSGLVVGATSYQTLALGGGLLSLALIPVLIRTRRRRVEVSPAA